MSDLNLDDFTPATYRDERDGSLRARYPMFPLTICEAMQRIAELERENARLKQLAAFMVQRALQIEAECLRSDDRSDLIYGHAVRQIEAYEDVIGEAVRDGLSV